jgi:hypothetical protein
LYERTHRALFVMLEALREIRETAEQAEKKAERLLALPARTKERGHAPR